MNNIHITFEVKNAISPKTVEIIENLERGINAYCEYIDNTHIYIEYENLPLMDEYITRIFKYLKEIE